MAKSDLSEELYSLGGALNVGLISKKSVMERLQTIVYESQFSDEKSIHQAILDYLTVELDKEKERGTK